MITNKPPVSLVLLAMLFASPWTFLPKAAMAAFSAGAPPANEAAAAVPASAAAALMHARLWHVGDDPRD